MKDWPVSEGVNLRRSMGVEVLEFVGEEQEIEVIDAF